MAERHTVNPKTTKEILRECVSQLEGLGFKKRAGEILTKPVSDDALGWVGLNTLTQFEDTMDVNPMIGIRYQPIHAVIAKVNHTKVHPYETLTFGKNIGYLTSKNQFLGFEFNAGEDFAANAKSLGETIREFGLPYMEEHCTLESVLPSILKECPWDYAGRRYVAGLMLKGCSWGEILAFAKTHTHERPEAGVRRFETFLNKAKQLMNYGRTPSDPPLDARRNTKQ